MKDIIRMNQLAGIITENQARKMIEILNEGQGQPDRYVSDYDDGIYIPLKKPFPTPEMKLKIAAAAKAKYGVDIKFEKNKATNDFSIFVPFAGDYENIMGILKKMRVPNNG